MREEKFAGQEMNIDDQILRVLELGDRSGERRGQGNVFKATADPIILLRN
jgi:hypothetical protein